MIKFFLSVIWGFATQNPNLPNWAAWPRILFSLSEPILVCVKLPITHHLGFLSFELLSGEILDLRREKSCCHFDELKTKTTTRIGCRYMGHHSSNNHER